MGSTTALVALTLLLSLVQSQALFFYVTQGSQRCFLEEVPKETLVLGEYKCPDLEAPDKDADASADGLRVVVSDPSGAAVLQRELDAEGRFAFTSVVGGEHVLCFSTTASRWFGEPKKFRVDLSLNVGEMAVDYTEVARKEHLSELEVEIRKLNDKLRDIMKEVHYQRGREEEFRETSESTSSRVQWWSIAQTIILIVSGIWQIRHLQQFFIDKKLK